METATASDVRSGVAAKAPCSRSRANAWRSSSFATDRPGHANASAISSPWWDASPSMACPSPARSNNCAIRTSGTSWNCSPAWRRSGRCCVLQGRRRGPGVVLRGRWTPKAAPAPCPRGGGHIRAPRPRAGLHRPVAAQRLRFRTLERIRGPADRHRQPAYGHVGGTAAPYSGIRCPRSGPGDRGAEHARRLPRLRGDRVRDPGAGASTARRHGAGRGAGAGGTGLRRPSAVDRRGRRRHQPVERRHPA